MLTAGTIAIGDLTVPRLGYGTMRLTGPGIFGPPADREQAVRVLRRAVELGVRVIDTSWYYGPDVANEILAEALRPYKADLVLVTKLGAARRPNGAWFPALAPDELRAGCERDLRLLGVDSIPVVHLRWMPGTSASFPDALDEFARLQEEGKIQRIGLSNVTAAQLDEAQQVVDVVTVSNAFSVVDRSDEAMVQRCASSGIAYLPYFPLGATTTSSDASAARNQAVRAVAERIDATPIQVALAWLLQHSPALLPIPGTSQ
ncbi:MAG: pyridoxine 4-dehydrogenase, partial [Frankiaceae bacterium]|nr:pyridoxine 4-dehydrogenase [Frankiaceae bacterium]